MLFISQNLDRAFAGANRVIDEIKRLTLEKHRNVPVNILRPVQTAVPKVDGKNRVRILIKCRYNLKTRKLFDEVYTGFMKNKSLKDINISIDINPSVIV